METRTLRRLERARRQRGLSRSAAIQQAVDAWLGVAEATRKRREYVEGYRRAPEDAASTKAWMAAQAWSAWEPEG